MGAPDYSRIDVTDYVKNHPNSIVTIALARDKRSEDDINDTDYVNINTYTNSDVSFRPKLKLWYTDTALPYTLSNLNLTNQTITVDLQNNTTEAKTVNGIYAVYNLNKLVGTKIVQQSMLASETKSLQQSIPIASGTTWDKIKVLVIDNDIKGLKALAQNAVLTKSV